MSGHRPFRELTREFSPRRRERVAARVAEIEADLALAREPPQPGKPSYKRRRARKRRVQ